MSAPSQIFTVTGLIDITPENNLLKPEYVFEDEPVDWDHFNMWLYEKELIRISEPIIQNLLSQVPSPMGCYYHTGSAQYVEQKGVTALQFQVITQTYLNENEFNDFLKESLSATIEDEFGPAYKALEELAYNHLPDEFCRDMSIRYRTESFSGLQERDAAEVMAYETFEMGNTDILECVKNTLLQGRPICEKIQSFLDEMDQNGFVDDMSTIDKVDFFHEVLKEVSEVTGVQVNYALWLADKDAVLNFYGKDMMNEHDYDAYEVGPVMLSDLGFDGSLYGYTDMPEPLTQRALSLIPTCAKGEGTKPSLSSQIQASEAKVVNRAPIDRNHTRGAER